MAQHARRARGSRSLGTLSPNLSMVAVGAGVLCVLGVALGLFAWTGPVTSITNAEAPSDRSVSFSYTADVPSSAAYDGTSVHSPDPVFRALTDEVDVRYQYQGEPGSVTVTAELAAASGWHSTLPLASAKSFSGDHFDGSVSLDLGALDRQAQRAAAIIGVPAEQVTVTVRPRFVVSSGAVFSPELVLSLSPTALATADASALIVKDPATVQTSSEAPRTLSLLRHEISVPNARLVSAAILVLGLLLGLLVAGLAHAGAPSNAGSAIRRRHANILVQVEPMTTPAGRPVVEVSEFATLVKLAERYGLLVLHWSRSDVETFVVQDESTTYRYRADAGHPPGQDHSPAHGPIDARSAR